VDAGPVLKGFGCAACAFGVGAARVNGHFEHAYPLTAEMLVASWPLPNGTRLFPRLLSNAADAPYLGEAAILFNLTRLPAEGVPIKIGGSLPRFVLIFFGTSIRVWPDSADNPNPVTPSVAETTPLDGSSPPRSTAGCLGRIVDHLHDQPVPWQNAHRAAVPGVCPTLPQI
jgi:hypothetical protein